MREDEYRTQIGIFIISALSRSSFFSGWQTCQKRPEFDICQKRNRQILSRSFRYLDLYGQKRDIAEAAFNLVSDESGNGKGPFSFLRGDTALGTLALEKDGNIVDANADDTIFHVFPEDFVQEELRERKYKFDGDIANQIAVDRGNIKLNDARSDLEKAEAERQKAYGPLLENFDAEKAKDLHGKAKINKQLKEYKALSLDALLERYAEKPASPEHDFAAVLKDLDSLKSIPAEPVYPDNVKAVARNEIDMDELAASLERMTSPSSVLADIKKKIDAHHGFYEEGAKIVRDEHRTSCPFCEQDITEPDPKAIIDDIVKYFEGEEEKHKDELRDFSQKLQQKEDALDQLEKSLACQKIRYDNLKRHVPSKKDADLVDVHAEIKVVRDTISALKSVIKQKVASLATVQSLPPLKLCTAVAGLSEVVAASTSNGSPCAINRSRCSDNPKNDRWSKADSPTVLLNVRNHRSPNFARVNAGLQLLQARVAVRHHGDDRLQRGGIVRQGGGVGHRRL